MERAKKRTVRLLSCDLTVPRDITSNLLDHSLAWLWLCYYDGSEDERKIVDFGVLKVKPERGMYDFGLDEDVPGDWLVWTETEHLKEPPVDKAISVIHDLRVLHSLGVRGYFIINEVGTMTFEKWQLSDHSIHTHTREVTFEGDPDEVTPVT